MINSEKEFTQYVLKVIDNIRKIDHVDYIEIEDMYTHTETDGLLSSSFLIDIDNKALCVMGCLDITIYQDESFGIGKNGIPFGINDLVSLQRVIKYFYGTPFELNLKKVNNLDFIRYTVSIPEIKVDNFRSLELYIQQMTISLNAIDKHCYYHL